MNLNNWRFSVRLYPCAELGKKQLTLPRVSTRCVLIFRDQDLSVTDLKNLAQGLGVASGKPKSSGLHKHTFGNAEVDRVTDDKIGEVIAITPTV